MTDEAAATERPSTFTQLLKVPVTMGAIEIFEVTVKEPTAGQWKQAGAFAGFESTIMLVSLTSGLLPICVEKLPISVVTRAGDFIFGFLEDDQTTGKAS